MTRLGALAGARGPTLQARSVAGDTRARRRRALARELDDSLLGPDESTVVHRFEDAWTIRRVERLADQRREGILGRNCLRTMTAPLPRVLSLRDPDNLPHGSFSGWRRRQGDALERALLADLRIDDRVVVGAEAVFACALLHPGARAHLVRLQEFARVRRDELPLLPSWPLDAIAAVQRCFPLRPTAAPDEGYAELLRRVEAATSLQPTVWPGGARR